MDYFCPDCHNIIPICNIGRPYQIDGDPTPYGVCEFCHVAWNLNTNKPVYRGMGNVEMIKLVKIREKKARITLLERIIRVNLCDL